MKKILLFIYALSIALIVCKSKIENVNPFKQGYKNIINQQSKLKSEHPAFSESENLQKAFDIDNNTKFLVEHPTNSIIIENNTPVVIKSYALTSANDAPGRDPKNWTLSGSTDGTSWEVIDQKSDQKFKQRRYTNTYNLERNTKEFSFYKLDLEHAHISVYEDNYLQIAEIELLALTKMPIADFKTSKSRAKIKDTIKFIDISYNAPNSWLWIFENGTPDTSNLQNPEVVYDTPGNHNVTLVTRNEFGIDTLLVKRKMKVYDPVNPWGGFYYPEIKLTPTDTVSDGYKRVIKVVPDFKKAINEITLGVCKQLYRNISEIPDFEKINFTFQWSDVIAAKGGNASAMKLSFSTKYIQNALKNKTDDAVKYELYGVLWHELTHGYQFYPSTTDNKYKSGYDYFAFLEGEADLVRINAGYHKTRHPNLGHKGHKYLSGYSTTGFFLKWIVDNYDSDFIYKFNNSAQTLNPWSYKIAIQHILQKDVDSLWEEYSVYVNNYHKTKKEGNKKRIDWTNM